MNPTQLITRDMKTGLYLPAFGLALVYNELGGRWKLLVAVLTVIFAAYSGVYVTTVKDRILKEMEEGASRDDIPNVWEISEYYGKFRYLLIVFLTLVIFFVSMFYLGWVSFYDLEGTQRMVLGSLVLVQIALSSKMVFKANAAGAFNNQ